MKSATRPSLQMDQKNAEIAIFVRVGFTILNPLDEHSAIHSMMIQAWEAYNE